MLKIFFLDSRANKKHHEYRIEIGFDNAQQKLGSEANYEENYKSKSRNLQGKTLSKRLPKHFKDSPKKRREANKKAEKTAAEKEKTEEIAENYWELLAEERRVKLEAAIEENKDLCELLEVNISIFLILEKIKRFGNKFPDFHFSLSRFSR